MEIIIIKLKTKQNNNGNRIKIFLSFFLNFLISADWQIFFFFEYLNEITVVSTSSSQ